MRMHADVFKTLSPELQACLSAGGLRHVAIIMDGNRRWAKARHLPTLAGHQAGVKALKNLVRFASDMGLSALTVYAFSTENWRRSAEEVGALMSLFVQALLAELSELDAHGVRICFVGDLAGLPKDVQNTLRHGMAKTQANTGLTLQVATNYGGRLELTQAAKTLATQVQSGEITVDDITEDRLATVLATDASLADPDVLIRTGGEQRWSNFLLWQCAYAEFMVTETLWPDFTSDAFAAVLSQFAGRCRRFGA